MCQPPSATSPKHAIKPETTVERCCRWIHQARPVMCVYLLVVHVLSFVALLHLPYCKWQTVLCAFVLYVVGCIGITMGVHRLWAHKSYKASMPLRALLMLCYSLANQGNIYHWVRDHRVHHKHSETERDPHDASRGLFFAHIGWLLLKKVDAVSKAGRKLDLSDIDADGVVQFQKKMNPWWNLLCCFVVPTVVPVYFWGETIWKAYLVAGVLKYAMTLHATWCVNSLAHYYGDRPYNTKTAHDHSSIDHSSSSKGMGPAENPFVAIVSQGEGWHNWHHSFPFDYACSEMGVSEQWNPTKLLIDISVALGLASGRRRAHHLWNARLRRWEQATGEGDQDRAQLEQSKMGLPLLRRRVVKVDGMRVEDLDLPIR